MLASKNGGKQKQGPIKQVSDVSTASKVTTPPPLSETSTSSSDTPPSPSPSDTEITAQPPLPSPTSLSLDFLPSETDSGGGRTGAKSSKDSLSSIEKRRKYLGRMALVVMGFGMIAQAAYLGREWEAEELKEKKLVSWTWFLIFDYER